MAACSLFSTHRAARLRASAPTLRPSCVDPQVSYGIVTAGMTTGWSNGLRTSACAVPSGVRMSIAFGTVPGATGQIGLPAATAAGVQTPNWKSCDSWLEPAGLVGAEPVLAGEHHGERPSRAGCAAQRSLCDRECDPPRDLLPRIATVPTVAPEASMNRCPKPCTSISRFQPPPGRSCSCVAGTTPRSRSSSPPGRGGTRRPVGAERAAERRCQIPRPHPEGHGVGTGS